MVGNIQVASMNPAITVGLDLTLGWTTPLGTESTEPMMEPTSTSEQLQVLSVSATDKGKGLIFPPRRRKLFLPKWIAIGASTVPTPFIIEEEEGPILGGEDIIPLPTNVHVEGIKQRRTTSFCPQNDTALEEQATRAASFIYDRAPGSYPSLFVIFFFFTRRGILTCACRRCLQEVYSRARQGPGGSDGGFRFDSRGCDYREGGRV